MQVSDPLATGAPDMQPYSHLVDEQEASAIAIRMISVLLLRSGLDHHSPVASVRYFQSGCLQFVNDVGFHKYLGIREWAKYGK